MFAQNDWGQEESAWEVIHEAIAGVLQQISDRELAVLAEDHALAIASSEIEQTYAASAIRYHTGHLIRGRTHATIEVYLFLAKIVSE